MAPVQHLDGTPHFHLKPDTSQPLRLELLANFVEIAGKKVDKAEDVKVGKMHCINTLSGFGLRRKNWLLSTRNARTRLSIASSEIKRVGGCA